MRKVTSGTGRGAFSGAEGEGSAPEETLTAIDRLMDLRPRESQLPTVERALYVASRMVGTERSRGYCLEMICADFLAGQTEESTAEETLLLIDRLVSLPPLEYQARLTGQDRSRELQAAGKC